MHLLKRTLLALTVVIPFFVVMAAVYARRSDTPPSSSPQLGIEISLDKPFYVPASTSDKVTSMFIRVPAVAGNKSPATVSAIRLDPRMENGKVKVTLYALTEDVDDLTTCRRWESLKSIPLATYVAGLDEEVQLSKLLDYGVGVGKKPLTFRVVPKRVLSPLPIFNDPEPCECGSCRGLICCPNPGECLNCGSCGSLCCNNPDTLIQ